MSADHFGNYLRQLRKAKGFTLDKLGGLTGFSYSYLSQLERGERGAQGGIPSPDILKKLAQPLGVTHIEMMIKAGHITEEEVLKFREEYDINEH